MKIKKGAKIGAALGLAGLVGGLGGCETVPTSAESRMRANEEGIALLLGMASRTNNKLSPSRRAAAGYISDRIHAKHDNEDSRSNVEININSSKGNENTHGGNFDNEIEVYLSRETYQMNIPSDEVRESTIFGKDESLNLAAKYFNVGRNNVTFRVYSNSNSKQVYRKAVGAGHARILETLGVEIPLRDFDPGEYTAKVTYDIASGVKISDELVFEVR
tara:strand:+ start:4999 stop:5652 length:654 start_codon:yes stop_codon:yes gene_type:complete